MEGQFYTIEELITITGLSKDHLTDTDGPIARVLKTFPDIELGDRKQGLNYEGVQKLTEYLEYLEDGHNYETWAKEQKQKTDNDGGGLVRIPVMDAEIVQAESQLNNSLTFLDNLVGAINLTLTETGDYYQNLGRHTGSQLANRYAQGIGEAIAEGIKETHRRIAIPKK